MQYDTQDTKDMDETRVATAVRYIISSILTPSVVVFAFANLFCSTRGRLIKVSREKDWLEKERQS